tara:strand:- start:76 stop:393 length:318 start_codon:yes stop_codon:yes gene_type:complete
MNDGKKKVSRFKTVKQKVIYLPHELAEKFEKYAKKNDITQSKIVCEGIVMRMSGNDDPFNQGFNQGLNEAMNIVNQTDGAKMMFPSGKSFAQLVCGEIEQYLRER